MKKLLLLLLLVLFSCKIPLIKEITVVDKDLQNYRWTYLKERVINYAEQKDRIIVFLYNALCFDRHKVFFLVIRGYSFETDDYTYVTYENSFILFYAIVDNKLILNNDIELIMDQDNNLIFDNQKIFRREPFDRNKKEKKSPFTTVRYTQ